MNNSLDPGHLHEALSGRVPPSAQETDIAGALRIAQSIAGMPLPPPPTGTGPALRQRFDAFLQARANPTTRDRLAGWFGAGPVPRPFAHRLAAGILAVSLIGSGTAAATGRSPADVIIGAGEFVTNAVRSFRPQLEPDDDSGMPTGLTTTPSTDETPEPPATTTPGETPGAVAATASATPGSPATPVTAAASATGTAGQAAQVTATGTPSLSTPTLPASPSPNASPPPSPAPSPPGTPEPASTEIPGAGLTTAIYSVATAGTVTLAYGPGVVQVASVAPSPGWTYTVEPEETGWKVDFRSGDQRIRFIALPGDPAPTTSVEDDSSGGGS
jgi:hypothetical protein